MLCDLVLIMEAGRFVVSGAPHELIERYCHPALLDIVVEDALSHDWARLLADELPEPRETARGIVVEVRDPVASMERLRTSSIEFISATVRPSSLTESPAQDRTRGGLTCTHGASWRRTVGPSADPGSPS